MKEVPSWARWDRLLEVREQLPREVLVPPLLHSSEFGCKLVCENLQVTGSYKVRAVCHLLTSRPPGTPVALASSGNFAVALAWAGQRLGYPVAAVMMQRSLAWKVDRVRSLGGRVVFCGNTTEERTEALYALEREGFELVDHLIEPEVLVGHATLGVDMARLGHPERVLVPASTGGLLAATALSLKQKFPGLKVVGLQPEGSNALVLSWSSGHLCRRDHIRTECDALTANRPGQLPWEVIRDWVDEVIEVPELAIRAAVVDLLERSKLLVEPGGAIGLAAVRNGQVASGPGTWIVLSGGNFDPARLRDWLA